MTNWEDVLARLEHMAVTDDLETSIFVSKLKEACNKQISKYPNIEGDGYGDNGELIYDTWICPDCGMNYEIDYDDYKFCPNCGQKIDREYLKDYD